MKLRTNSTKKISQVNPDKLMKIGSRDRDNPIKNKWKKYYEA